MFEKEAEERVKHLCLSRPNAYVPVSSIEYWKDGAEFGYNKVKEDADKMKSRFLELCNLKDMRIEKLEKANEWHYVKDGDLPKDDENFICMLENGYKLECYYDPTTKRWYDNYFHHDIEYGYYQSKVIAWKEIVLPELKENE